MPGPDAGVIHDIGFRHYDGPRLGRAYLLRSLAAVSLKGAYGLGRSTRSKVLPFLMLAVLVVPALILVVVLVVTGGDELPLPYSQYVIVMQLPIAIFVAAQAPVSVSRDLRFRLMPLYFSRPLTRADYVLAKLAAMTAAVLILLVVPLAVLYAGALLAKLPFWHETRLFLGALAGAVLLSLVLAALGLLVASFTPRRGLGVAAVVAVVLVMTVVSVVLQGIAQAQGNDDVAGYAGALSPFSLVDGVQVRLLGGEAAAGSPPPPGALGGLVFLAVIGLVVAGSFAVLRLRYRKVSAA